MHMDNSRFFLTASNIRELSAKFQMVFNHLLLIHDDSFPSPFTHGTSNAYHCGNACRKIGYYC